MIRRLAATVVRMLVITMLAVTSVALPARAQAVAQANAQEQAPPAGPRVKDEMPRVQAGFNDWTPVRSDHRTTITISTIVLVVAIVVLVLVLI